MKVDPHNTAAVATTGSASSAGTKGVGHGADARAAQTDGLSQDKLELSGLASNLARAEAAGLAARAGYVDEIARLYKAGQYEVDSGALSRRLIQEALDNGPTGGAES